MRTFLVAVLTLAAVTGFAHPVSAQLTPDAVPACTIDPLGDASPRSPGHDLHLACVTVTDNGFVLEATGAWPTNEEPVVRWLLGGEGPRNVHAAIVTSFPDIPAEIFLSDGTTVYGFTCRIPRAVEGSTITLGPVPRRCIDARGPLHSHVSWGGVYGQDDLQLDWTHDLRPRADRLGGSTAAGSSAAIALDSADIDDDTVYLTRDDQVVDALTGGSLTDGPILRVPSCGALPAATVDALSVLRPDKLVALGGQAALCDATLEEARAVTSRARVERAQAPTDRCTPDVVNPVDPEPQQDGEPWQDVTEVCMTVHPDGRFEVVVHAAGAAPTEEEAAQLVFAVDVIGGIGDGMTILRGRQTPGGGFVGDEGDRDLIVLRNREPQEGCHAEYAVHDTLDAVTVTLDDVACTDPLGAVEIAVIGNDPVDPWGRVTFPGIAEVATERLAGASRIETAVAIARRRFDHGADRVYLARGDVFADVIAAGMLDDGPILLVPSCGPLPAVVAEELRRTVPQEVVVLGGPNAVCDQLAEEAARVGGEPTDAPVCLNDPAEGHGAGVDVVELCLRGGAGDLYADITLATAPPTSEGVTQLTLELWADAASADFGPTKRSQHTVEFRPDGPRLQEAPPDACDQPTVALNGLTLTIGPMRQVCVEHERFVDFVASTTHWDGTTEYLDRVPDGSDLTGGVAGRMPVAFGSVPLRRLMGPTRLHTAVEVSRQRWPSGAVTHPNRPDVAYLGNAHDFGHSVTVGTSLEGPLLLVPDCGDLPDVVADELARIDVIDVTALGDETQVCDEMLQQALAAAGG